MRAYHCSIRTSRTRARASHSRGIILLWAAIYTCELFGRQSRPHIYALNMTSSLIKHFHAPYNTRTYCHSDYLSISVNRACKMFAWGSREFLQFATINVSISPFGGRICHQMQTCTRSTPYIQSVRRKLYTTRRRALKCTQKGIAFSNATPSLHCGNEICFPVKEYSDKEKNNTK